MVKKLSRKERDKFYKRQPSHAFRMDKLEFVKAKQKAREDGRSLSEIIRKFLNGWVEGNLSPDK